MNWTSPLLSRQPLPAASSHHQTLLGKTLFEHGDCQLVATVASSSSSIRNSSLGPNLLALILADERTLPLFTSIFCSSTDPTINTTLQFAKKLSLSTPQEDEAPALWFTSLIKNTKYFQKSLQEMYAQLDSSSSFWSLVLSSSPVFTSLKKLKIETCCSEELLQNLATMFPHVEEFTIRDMAEDKLSPDSFIGLSRFNNLSSLSVVERGYFTDACLQKAIASSSSANNLKWLDLTSCSEITDTGIRAISATLVNLTSLNLRSCDQITDGGVQDLSTKLRNLTLLNLYDCHKITDNALVSIGTNLIDLRSLDLSFCTEITDVGLQSLTGLGNLTSLNLAWNKKITDSGIQAIATSGLVNLTSLSLKNCGELTGIGFRDANFAKLTSLNLAFCGYVTDAGIQAMAASKIGKNLTSLNLLSCGEITDISLQIIAAKFTNLTSLLLLNCTKITDVGMQVICSALVKLKELDLYNCDKITDASLEAIAASNLVDLTSLILYNCGSLTEAGKANVKKMYPGLKLLD